MKSSRIRRLAVLSAVYALTLTVTACAAEETKAAAGKSTESAAGHTAVNMTADGALDTAGMFTERDLIQTADTDGAEYQTVSAGETYTIREEGVYVFSGEAEDVQIVVEAGSEDKVQIVLDGLSVTNEDRPVIFVRSADKVFVTTTDSDNSLTVTGSFTDDGTDKTDAVIFAKDDLVINGTGTLKITSSDNGISCKDDLKITGGTLSISCANDALEANDSIRVADGDITIVSKKDGLHSENDDDDTLGYIYICGGTLSISAADDGIHGTTVIQIDGGTLDITASEGIEATWVQINDGTLRITAADDGINAGRKSSACDVLIEINGGDITVSMGRGDTDAVDSNGSLKMTGGKLDITAQSAFDVDGTITHTGGTVIVNGTEQGTITNSMMQGPGMGGQMPGGQMPGGMGGKRPDGMGGKRPGGN